MLSTQSQFKNFIKGEKVKKMPEIFKKKKVYPGHFKKKPK